MSKAISIRAPWWVWILETGQPWQKTIENRTRRSHYRGPVLIHASSWWREQEVLADQRSAMLAARADGSYPVPPLTMGDMKRFGGHIVGIADMVDCVEAHDSPWFCGPFGYVLENARWIAEPFAQKGALGLFEVEYDIEKARKTL